MRRDGRDAARRLGKQSLLLLDETHDGTRCIGKSLDIGHIPVLIEDSSSTVAVVIRLGWFDCQQLYRKQIVQTLYRKERVALCLCVQPVAQLYCRLAVDFGGLVRSASGCPVEQSVDNITESGLSRIPQPNGQQQVPPELLEPSEGLCGRGHALLFAWWC